MASIGDKIRETPFEIVWECPIQVGNGVGKEKFGYSGSWPTKGKG